MTAKDHRGILAAIFLLVATVLPAGADVHPNTAPGFPVDQSFHVGDVDNVNLFNGSLTLTIPLGGSYPVGGGFSYSLKLVYNGGPWTLETITGTHPNGDPAGTVNQASYYSDCSNAGLGWRVSLGRMNPPCQAPDESPTPPPVYQDENGTDHIFYPTLHKGDAEDANPAGVTDVRYTRDGSYLRLKVLAGGEREIEFPDGTRRTFHGSGTNAGLPKEIRDSFGNKLTIDYGTANQWILTDSQNRTHKIFFGLVGDNNVIDHVDLQAIGETTAIYDFQYTEREVGFACLHNNALGGSSDLVPLLTAVVLPDGSSYQAAVSDYITAISADQAYCTNSGGNLTGLTLPTLGRLQWTWQKYLFPSGSSQKPRLQTNDGVATRKMVSGGTDLGTWTYQWATVPSTPLTAKEHTTTVTDPLGHRTVHYFSVATVEDSTGTTWTKFDYSLPFTWYQPLAGVPGMNLSRQVLNAGGTLLRSEYVQYERDPFEDGAPLNFTNTNRRVSRSRTVYEDDGGLWSGVKYSGFDGLGHYRQQQTEAAAGFQGADRTHFGNYNPSRGTYTVNLPANTGAGYSLYPASSPWVLETMTYAYDTEGSQTAQADFCYAPDSATVTRRRVHRLNGSTPDTKDLVTVYDLDGLGNVMAEKSYGGDSQGGIGNGDLCSMTLLSPEYQIHHTWSSGVRATSQYAGTNFYVLNQTIDPSTGLVASSKDSAELQTNFEYDALGRMIWSKPLVGNRGSWTEYVYDKAMGSTLPVVTVKRRNNGATTGTPLAIEFYLFDSFGRLSKQQRQLPSGSNSTRVTTYDGAGNKATVSEIAVGASPAAKTTFLFYDPFGRPGTIRPPDGQAHDVTLTYQGVRQVSRTVKIATNASGAEAASTTTEVYDRHGRLYSVAEPSGSGGALVTTSYGYDVGNRLTSVLSGSQTRSFAYDRSGLLTSETHPEKGPSGNGAVTYTKYDSRGHTLRKTDGPNDLAFTYDQAERLSQVKDQIANRVLKSFTYAPANGSSDFSLGKLQKATRHNYLSVGAAATPVTVIVDETYTYGGRDGRVSARDTALQVSLNNGPFTSQESFTQGFAYNALGLTSSLAYPTCTHPGCKPPPAIFTDVPAGHPNQWEIEAIYRAGITGGCNTTPLQYCPAANVTRAQMAVFLILASSGASYVPPAATCTIFQDVACSHWAIAWIEELYHRGLTTGCSATPRLYCPETQVSKAEMSVFLLRNREGLSYLPPACTSPSPFSDVPCSHWAAPWILEANRQGIIPGCGGTNFCPDNPPITRAQMAGYLARGYDLPITIPPATERTLDFTYTQGLLTEVKSGALTYGSLFYHPNLLVSQVTHANNVIETQTNDPNSMRRPAALTTSGPVPSASWSSGTYSYDGAGNIKSIGTAAFTYDKVNRLVAASLYDGPTGGGTLKQQSYAFDPYGNITSITTNGSQRNTPTSTSTNRLTGSTGYDAAGNMTGWNGAAYQYDRFNQMTRMVSGSEDWNYIYTADDERLWSFSPNLSRWAIRDLGGKVLREYLSDSRGWTVGTDYIYRDGLLLAAETQTGRRHFHLDHLGTPRLITLASGDRDSYHVYYPFGEEATAFNQDGERMKFTGHERDLASPAGAGDDLDYMHARHESPVTGRFLSVDKQGGSPKRPQTLNRYAYVSGNPLRKIDPNGLAELEFTIKTFIPTASVSLFGTSYGGDARGFSYDSKRYRSIQVLRVETDPSRASNPLRSQAGDVGVTRRLSPDPASLKASTENLIASGSRDAAGNAMIAVRGSADNPLANPSAAIDYSLKISAPPAGDKLSVSIAQDGFPAMEIYVKNENGQVIPVYQFDPAAVGNGLGALFPVIGDQNVQVNCTGVTSKNGSCAQAPK